MLLESLLLPLSGIVAKQLLGLWISDESTLDLSKDLAAALSNTIKDGLERSMVESKFENFGMLFSKEIQTAVEQEKYDDLDSSKIINAVNEALQESKITSSLLTSLDLQPNLLEDHILSTDCLSQRDLYGDESDVYKLIIRNLSHCLIGVSSKLPQFKESAVRNLLSRETAIAQRIEIVIAEIQKISGNQEENPAEKEINFEKKYRNAVKGRYNNVELYGADISNSGDRRQDINIAYISLNLQCNDKESDAIAAEKVLQQKNKILVTGLAGSGKTTFLQWIAVKSSSQTFRGGLSNLNNKFPFFIRLRQIEDGQLPTHEEFVQQTVASISGNREWASKKLESGDAIVLIDGVDELPVDSREEVRLWLKELTTAYEKSTFIITSRPTAVEEEWLKTEGFVTAEIQDMDIQHIDEFIEHWHCAVDP